MTTYTIIKSNRNGYLIDDGSGRSIRYATKRLAEQTVAVWVRRDAEKVVFTAERDAYRRANIATYLAGRAARTPSAQLNLF